MKIGEKNGYKYNIKKKILYDVGNAKLWNFLDRWINNCE